MKRFESLALGSSPLDVRAYDYGDAVNARRQCIVDMEFPPLLLHRRGFRFLTLGTYIGRITDTLFQIPWSRFELVSFVLSDSA